MTKNRRGIIILIILLFVIAIIAVSCSMAYISIFTITAYGETVYIGKGDNIVDEDALMELLPEGSVYITKNSDGSITITDRNNEVVTFPEWQGFNGIYFIYNGKLFRGISYYQPHQNDPLPDDTPVGQSSYAYVNLSFDWTPGKYSIGRVVRHNGKFYIAVDGMVGGANIIYEPGTSMCWREIKAVSETDFYDDVNLPGIKNFENPKPGVIEFIEQGDDSQIPEWSSMLVYIKDDVVTYNGVTYRAKWWTHNDTPGISDVWEAI